MQQPAHSPAVLRARAARKETLSAATKPLLCAAVVVVFVVWAHLGSGLAIFSHQARTEPGWEEFRRNYQVDSFGRDGYFVRAVQNGYNLTHQTPDYAWRFTRKTATDPDNSCSSCHSNEDLAYALVNGDRFVPELDRRISFEESVMRCYAKHLDGFVPTIYDPAVRDVRIFARMVAHHLQLGEGSLGGTP
ncbi:hypothetical protein [Marinobacterium rhizophilum]|uniref:Cytochrome c domain-containing protein n=1 Tax=Marinobacterium rhizophilum TaxID=420402 RepID=A0ABY5HIB9_9GAMM|nr:hypothetical protein [Marinobacterium rhizophilum]UTW11358.1 hypothetical protein KDW95_19175 [Marinobacterium rhizophilum]